MGVQRERPSFGDLREGLGDDLPEHPLGDHPDALQDPQVRWYPLGGERGRDVRRTLRQRPLVPLLLEVLLPLGLRSDAFGGVALLPRGTEPRREVVHAHSLSRRPVPPIEAAAPFAVLRLDGRYSVRSSAAPLA
ncbi:hypothetical protein GCM10027610_060500 [Dactylosporangium cerinum]